MRCLDAFLFRRLRGPVATLPIDAVSRRHFCHAFPPYIAIVSQRDIRKNRIFFQCRHAVEVRLLVGARRHTKVTSLRINCPEVALRVRLNPSNVITDRRNFPTLLSKPDRRNQHSKVCFSTRRRESRRDMVFFAPRRLHTQNQHVFSQPTHRFFVGLTATHCGRNAQRETLLAQQGVSAIARAVRPDFARFGEMHNVFRFVAGPNHVFLPCCHGCANGMNTGHELPICAKNVIHLLAHARHHAHVDDNVGGVGQLDANLSNRGPQRTHRERNDVQGTPLHRTLEQLIKLGAHLGRRNPVICRACGVFILTTYECTVFYASHIIRRRARQKRIGALGGVELDKHPSLHHFRTQAVVL